MLKHNVLVYNFSLSLDVLVLPHHKPLLLLAGEALGYNQHEKCLKAFMCPRHIVLQTTFLFCYIHKRYSVPTVFKSKLWTTS